MASTDPTGYLSIPPDLIRGVSWKQPCRAATTANITIATALNAGDSIDGVTLAAGDRVLVKDQSTGSQNGIYVVAATPVRAFDMDQDLTTAVPAEEVMGAIVYVIAGTTNGGTTWRNTNTTAPTLGTTALTFASLGTGGGAPTTVDYLVGTAQAGLSAEIVVGTTPGGELGGTWASPTVDATHSGSAHVALGSATPLIESGSGAAGSAGASSHEDHVHPAASGSGTLTTVKDEGSNLSTAVVSLDFVGAGVTATGTTAVTVTIPGGGGGGNSKFLGGLPSGTFDRAYTWASTVESWTTTAGTLSSTGGRLRLTHTSPAVAIEPTGSTSTFADGEIVVDWKPTSITGSVGLLFRVADASNFYMVTIQNATPTQIYKCVAGGFTAIGAGIGGAAFWSGLNNPLFGHQYRMMVRFIGTSIKLYMDGTLVYSLIDSAITAAGRAGLRADNATLEVDNMSIYITPDLVTGNVSTP
jgi:hypothetical protein